MFYYLTSCSKLSKENLAKPDTHIPADSTFLDKRKPRAVHKDTSIKRFHLCKSSFMEV